MEGVACFEYTCADCCETFHTDQTESDAWMEYQETFSEEMRAEGTEPPVLVCDDCYNARLAAESPEQAFRKYKERLG